MIPVLVVLFSAVGTIIGLSLVLLSQGIRNRIVGPAIMGFAVAVGAMVWSDAGRLNEEIDLCDDPSSGRYVGRDHPACSAARN